MTVLSISNWHARFTQQAGWSAHLRQYIFTKIHMKKMQLMLDVGCGTGALEAELFEQDGPIICGIDIDLERVIFAQNQAARHSFTCGDGFNLPFPDNTFDASFCHYLLLWVKEPYRVLTEMTRVTKTGGYILALAEPDHSARIDWPEPLLVLGGEQTRALVDQGADIQAGRKLAAWFCEAGLELVESGLLGGQWQPSENEEDLALEWMTIKDDLNLGNERLRHLTNIDQKARREGSRVLYVPVFYAIGKKCPGK